MKETFFKKSLNRIYQELYSKNETASGKIVEFGASEGSSKNFTNHIKILNNYTIFYADKITNENKKILKEDLEKELTFDNNSIDNILIFNVLEHIYNPNNAIKEINRCLKSEGYIIGSTPFIHRIHNAPGDFNRYTPSFIEKVLSNNNFDKISIEIYGKGPFTAAYAIIFDYSKLLPLLNNFILSFCLFIDSLINVFIKTDLKKIYPITICFKARKIKTENK